MIYISPQNGEQFVFQPQRSETKPYEVSELVWFDHETEKGTYVFKRADRSMLELDSLVDIFPFFIEKPSKEPKVSKINKFYR